MSCQAMKYLSSMIGSLCLLSLPAQAGGLFFSERGVRPLARGGALVAGADDLGAIWYNPAGLADAGDTFLADSSWLHYTADFTRQVQVADSSGSLHDVQFPTVSGTTPFLPIPTLAISHALGQSKQWTIAAGVDPPYATLASKRWWGRSNRRSC